MTRPLPPRPNLDQLKRQAKEITRTHRDRNPEVCQVLRHLHQFSDAIVTDILDAPLTLSEAQYALAIDYGFSSWHALRQHMLNSNPGGMPAATGEPVVYPSTYMQSLAEKTFRRNELPVNHTCVWQSDAIYRESLESRAAWREQGAECVNCDTSTLYAVSDELGIESVGLTWITDSTCQGNGPVGAKGCGEQTPVSHRLLRAPIRRS